MTYDLSPDVTATETADGLVLLDLRSGRYWQLNPTASGVLGSLLAGASPDEAARELSDRAGIPAERSAGDVRQLIRGLRDHRLVVTR
ncbi:lasso peptide biosynthesis PqqD family chaperone [Symbioplanes lichenis]|uniref:lasso peptide biosynthesis PqqD family chaperone n=1 Tax=Symbioplanes lichenis TaxID=1629072 RepID=UPI0027384260|nr:lasso peptide biosynthesis PqqD family chaperone [Actinoplanes lichenis]